MSKDPPTEMSVSGGELSPIENVRRTSEFWLRASSIYFGYKATQIKALALQTAGWTKDRLESEVWLQQHQKAAEQMYSLCVDMRGFYLKTGQFLGARGDFMPEPLCRKLSLLHDQVPPMPASQARAVIEEELGVPLDFVFEWIDLEKPLGSASISQVHKAKLRALPRGRQQARRGWWWWQRGWFPLDFLPFLRAPAPTTSSTTTFFPAHTSPLPLSPLQPTGKAPIDMQVVWSQAPKDGIVAVKVQYPNALPTMSLDLGNLRLWAAFLSKTELKFDMLSAVDELASQIKLEFDFCREARIMDAVSRQFEGLGHKIQVPRSVPSMVTQRLLVMDFLDGVPITKMKDQVGFQNLSEATKKLAARKILSRVSEAYGRMVLLDGLFQADGHPGNILVMKGGKIGLIDYGQSKQLPDSYRAAFARLVLALATQDEAATGAAVDGLGVVTDGNNAPLKAELARGMFDTRGNVDPFDPDSPIKKMAIEKFPSDMFFVLRVVQLLRGLANGMGVYDFSSAKQWKPFAQEAVKELGARNPPGSVLLEEFTRPL